MIDRTLAWFNTVHRHFDAELLQLLQLHISEDECLILLSEEIIIMFLMIHDIRKQRMVFTLKGKRVEYMVRCIWLTLQAHAVMDGFVKRGLKYNSAISAAFIRFLTKQTGQNVSTGIGSQIKVLTEALEKAVKMAKEAADAAKEATRVSKEASTWSNTASSAADKAVSDIKAILAKNSTLKKPSFLGNVGFVATVVEGEGVVVEARLVVERWPVLDISTSGIIAGRLRVVAPPLPFVIVAGG
jgi:hypothetical protein